LCADELFCTRFLEVLVASAVSDVDPEGKKNTGYEEEDKERRKNDSGADNFVSDGTSAVPERVRAGGRHDGI